MKRVVCILFSALLVPAMAASKEPAKPISADSIQVLKIAAKDERAVIKTPEGKTRVIKPGDTLGASGKIIEIAADRVVIEEKAGKEIEKIIIRLIEGKQKVERMRKTAVQSPVMLAPAASDVKGRSQGNGVR